MLSVQIEQGQPSPSTGADQNAQCGPVERMVAELVGNRRGRVHAFTDLGPQPEREDDIEGVYRVMRHVAFEYDTLRQIARMFDYLDASGSDNRIPLSLEQYEHYDICETMPMWPYTIAEVPVRQVRATRQLQETTSIVGATYFCASEDEVQNAIKTRHGPVFRILGGKHPAENEFDLFELARAIGEGDSSLYRPHQLREFFVTDWDDNDEELQRLDPRVTALTHRLTLTRVVHA